MLLQYPQFSCHTVTATHYTVLPITRQMLH